MILQLRSRTSVSTVNFKLAGKNSLGKKFNETIEPLGKVDAQEIFALLEKFEKAKK